MDKLEEKILEVKLQAKENLVPIVREKTLQKLLEVCKQNSVQSVLEIGTATGFSGLNLLLVAENLTTIEKNEQRFKEAQKNFKEAEVEKRVKQYLGDASEVLEKLKEEKKQYDLVFLDGPKGQYVRYLPLITLLLKDDGILFADNILVCGLMHDETKVNHKNRTMVRNMRAFLEEIQSSKIFSTQTFEIEDGFAICQKKSIKRQKS